MIDYTTFLYKRYAKLAKKHGLMNDLMLQSETGKAFRKYLATVARDILNESNIHYELLYHISKWDIDEHWNSICKNMDWELYADTIFTIRRGYEKELQLYTSKVKSI